ncbi:unnamed protein product, partial [Brenthis ino]
MVSFAIVSSELIQDISWNGYYINENCNAALESILQNLLNEDKYLRTYRRGISFGQNIQKDLIPLLINTKDGKTVELLIKILGNLTIPVECLLSVDTVTETDIGRHTVFEINNLLSATKIAISDHRATKVIIDFMKKNADSDQKPNLSPEQCTNISDTLLFLRNVLHIPEDMNRSSATYGSPPHTVHNRLLWNLFSQSIDKVLIKLMTIPDAAYWGVTMVQLIALFYKDQHVATLHKLLNLWLEASLSESSEDNESNTSPANRDGNDSSPMLTSDESSDIGSGKCNEEPNSVNSDWDNRNNSDSGNQTFLSQSKTDKTSDDSCESTNNNVFDSSKKNNGKKDRIDLDGQGAKNLGAKNDKITVSEISDYGYGTQIEIQEAISTSSNEDEMPTKKPVHQKPHNPKQRLNSKVRSFTSLQERKRKKIVKRCKANIINVQGLSHNSPTNDDISIVLKEFTVDFLLKGYNALVRNLHTQILTNIELEIDTSHFFWLVTYFLKFATQIELDLEHVCSVLSFEMVSYLTAEGVNLCEQFELAIKLDGNDLKPNIRRLHLVVTAIREFVQAIELYKKSTHICNGDKETLLKLQIKMSGAEELRSLLVLLLRNYNPKYHSKQYLQDLIVTNHILLTFLDNVMRSPEFKGSNIMVEHIKQFASPEIMYQYGLLLEDYESNGEFVNDCIFTLMHHVGGELASLIHLFQPNILKIFTSIWKSEFEICDDWSDLIEYVINTFVKKPYNLQCSAQLPLDVKMFDEDKSLKGILDPAAGPEQLLMENKNSINSVSGNSVHRWTEEELSLLNWNYMQCNSSSDVIGDMVKMFKEDDIVKSRESVVKELYNQFIINKVEYERLLKIQTVKDNTIRESKDIRGDEIGKLCDELGQDGKVKFLNWVQTVLLDTCFAKIYLERVGSDVCRHTTTTTYEKHTKTFETFLQKPVDMPAISPVSYHSLLLKQSVPLVPWNCHQASICKDLKFLQLLHKLGFHMPVDTGKVFIRIPHFWTPDFIYEVAGTISPIDISKLKFSINEISQNGVDKSPKTSGFTLSELTKEPSLSPTPDTFYQIHNKKQNHFAAIVNFTPTPGSSFSTVNDDVNKPSWLELVQKSQEYKITMDVGKTIIAENEELPKKPNKDNPKLPMLPQVSLPASVQQLPSFIYQDELECYNNSMCETASVASDMTRMYVSDEDEQPAPARRKLTPARGTRRRVMLSPPA